MSETGETELNGVRMDRSVLMGVASADLQTVVYVFETFRRGFSDCRGRYHWFVLAGITKESVLLT